MKTKLYTASSSRARNFLLLSFLLVFSTIANAQYTIFDEGTDMPPGGENGANANNDDATGTGVITSVKFQVTQVGTISAAKFFKGTTNNGTHYFTLHARQPDNSNLIIGQVLVTGETADGWQTMNFGSPIAVAPNVIYTLTLFSSNGVYAANSVEYQWNPSFNTDLTPLIVLAGDGNTDPTGVGNGAYAYTNDPDFYPISSFNSSNYFLDVVYTPTFLLPVSFTDFKATTRDYDANLTWQTASEQNNMGFEVQRSTNGSDYEALAFVNGAGESSSKKYYSFNDRNLAPGLYYYRLKQVDNDGRFKYSAVVTATIGRSNNIILYTSFPNPVKTTAKINYVLPSTMPITLTLVDVNGRIVKVLDKGVRQSGSHVATLDASGLMKGIYFYKLETEDHPVVVQRLMVQ